MAALGWGKDHPVNEWLYEEPYRFDFFQAVRLLEMADSTSAPIGEGAEPAREAVRFKSAVGLAFAASDVADVKPPTDAGGAAEMTVNFMGLAGAMGPLHMPSTELIVERAWRRDTSLRDFLDIFNHRLVSLLYRIRKQHRVGLDSAPPGEDRASSYLYSVIGIGTPNTRGRMQVKDRALLFYAGLLGQQPRSMAGLERLLTDYFGTPARGVPFSGRWHELEEGQWTVLGARGRNRALGVDTTAGTRVWDQQGAFEVVLGPLTFEQFQDFLPTGWAFRSLCDLTRFYVGDEMDFAFRLTLKASEIPPTRLGARGGARLGWTSWLKTQEWPEDDTQVSVSPDSLRAFAGALDIPYFGLPPDKLAELVGRMSVRGLKENSFVVRQGDAGDSMFVIRRGSARVIRREEDGRELYLATLREGDYFGEMALIMGRARTATIITLEECEILELKKQDLDEFTARYPRFAATLRVFAEARLKKSKR